MSPPDPLEALAAAAEEHARREHGLALDLDPDAADRILRAEAAKADPERVETLGAAKGMRPWRPWREAGASVRN